MRNKLLFGIVFFTFVFILSSFVSATIYRVGDSRYINRHGVQHWVSSACALDVMIPTGTSGEWTAFRSNSPACVTLQTCNPDEVCCDSSGNIRPNGYVVSSGDYECQDGSGSPNCCVECQTDTICTGDSGTSTSTTTGACRNANDGERCESYSGYSDAPERNDGCQVRERARTCSSGACTGSYTLRWVDQNEGGWCTGWYNHGSQTNRGCSQPQRRDTCTSGSCTWSGNTRSVNVNEDQFCRVRCQGTNCAFAAREQRYYRCSSGSCSLSVYANCWQTTTCPYIGCGSNSGSWSECCTSVSSCLSLASGGLL